MRATFAGEYGTNFAIPGFLQWVQDMRVPWWIATMRNEWMADLEEGEIR